jgi:hypothetical protein
VTVRHFDASANGGDGEAVWFDAPAAIAGVAYIAPYTVAVCWRAHSVAGMGLYKVFTTPYPPTVQSFCHAANPFSDGFVWKTDGNFQQTQAYADEQWLVSVWTRPTGGTSALRSHFLDLATGVWSHVAEGNLNDGGGSSDHILIGRLDRPADGAEPLDGDMAGIAFYDVEMDDATVEATFTAGLQGWLDAGPFWMPDLTGDEGTPAVDLTGNGGDQIDIAGTTAVEGEDPPNFDLSLGETAGRFIRYGIIGSAAGNWRRGLLRVVEEVEPGAVTWVPPEFTLAATTPAVVPQPVTVAWQPLQLTLEAGTPAAQPGAVTVAWTPPTFTLAATTPAAQPGAVTVAWTPPEWTLSAPVWAAEPQPVTVNWSPPSWTLQAPLWDVTGTGTVLWQPLEFTLQVGGVAAQARVAWVPGDYTLEAPAWPVLPQPVTILWTPASFTLEMGPAPALIPGVVTVPWLPGDLVLELGSWALSTVVVPRWTILRAVAWAVELDGVGPEPDLVAYGQGGLVEHTLKIGDERTLRYDLRRDLTGVLTVTFRVVDDVGGPLIINRLGVIVDAVDGLVDLAVQASDYGAGKLEMSDRYPDRRPFLLEAVTNPPSVTHPNRGQERLWLEPTT